MYEFSEEVNNSTNELEKSWRLIDTIFYNYFLLRLNNEKLIVILLENVSNHNRIDIEGFVLPKNDSYTISIPYDFFDDSNGEKKELSLKDDYQFLNKDLYRVENGNEIRDLVFNQSLLDNNFDTIFITNNFIVGNLQNKLSIHNLKLENITPVNTRGFQSGSNGRYCQIIVNNDIFWLDESGELSKDKTEDSYFICGTVTYFSRHITNNQTGYLLEESIDNFDGKDPILKLYSLFPNDTYDTLLFLNGTEQLKFDGNSGIGGSFYLPDNPYNYMIVKKNDKYGLIEIETLSDEPTFNIKLPADYDLIEISSYYLPILVKKNNLLGYYPLNEKPKYKLLKKFEGSFARFTLPNNKKGWLSLDGIEYLDE